MANGYAMIERRMSLLETVCREDRVRFRKFEEFMRRGEERWERNDRRFEGTFKVLTEHSRRIEEQGRRIDASLKLLHRLMER